MKLSFSLLISLLVFLSAAFSYEALIDEDVRNYLLSDSTTPKNIFVFPRAPAISSLSRDTQTFLQEREKLLALPLSVVTRAEKRQYTFDLRKTIADLSQKHLVSQLEKKGLKIRTFWINNSVYIFGATPELIRELAGQEEVVEIRGDYVNAYIEPFKQEESLKSDLALEWNILHINADKAWNITKGEGSVVAIIDTGVRETHEALQKSYRGYQGAGREVEHDYNWFDPKEFQNDPWWCTPGICSPSDCCKDTPFDPIGHGSHVTGTAVGSELHGIGVAPNANWVAAKGCRDGSCLNYGLTSSAEWVVCPTRLNGRDPDCSKGADIVSNSWGGGGGDMWYKEYTAAWRQAGMIPVFSQGNSGPRCGTMGSPGDYEEVIGVGAIDNKNMLVDFSSRGPGSSRPGIRASPTITAPGRSIRSASSTVGSTNNSGYSVSSGTSMSAPHVSGLVALLLSHQPKLEFDDIISILDKSAFKGVPPPENGRTGSDECGGVRYDQLPSHHYGFGSIDAYAALLAVSSL